MELYEWTEQFIKFRNIVRRNKIKYELINNTIKVNIQTNKGIEKEIYLIDNKIENLINLIPANNKKQKYYLVCLNLKKNVHFVYENWHKLSILENVLIIFAEPNTNNKWILKPHIHNKIINKENLKEGLLTLHKSVAN